MECDEEFVLAAEELPTQQATPAPKEDEGAATVLPPLETDTSAACDVVVGSEEWHTGIDPVSLILIATINTFGIKFCKKNAFHSSSV